MCSLYMCKYIAHIFINSYDHMYQSSLSLAWWKPKIKNSVLDQLTSPDKISNLWVFLAVIINIATWTDNQLFVIYYHSSAMRAETQRFNCLKWRSHKNTDAFEHVFKSSLQQLLSPNYSCQKIQKTKELHTSSPNKMLHNLCEVINWRKYNPNKAHVCKRKKSIVNKIT